MEANPTLITDARVHDLGDGFMVRRMLPVLQTRRVGPFVFFDHIGPVFCVGLVSTSTRCFSLGIAILL